MDIITFVEKGYKLKDREEAISLILSNIEYVPYWLGATLLFNKIVEVFNIK